MYILYKTIDGRFNYYWNDVNKQWEGLWNNSTKITEGRMKYLSMQNTRSELSYILNGKHYKLC